MATRKVCVVRKLYGTGFDRAATFDTPHMRIAAASLLVTCVAALLATADVRAAGPALRIVPGPSLAVAGTGFVPRTIVLVRLKGPDVARLVRVRSGRNGGFLRAVRDRELLADGDHGHGYPEPERTDPDALVRARVPAAPAARPGGQPGLAVRLGHGVEVERLVEHALLHTGLARDLAQRAA